MKYAHLFNSASEQQSAYENNYIEPWVSYTISIDKVHYSKVAPIYFIYNQVVIGGRYHEDEVGRIYSNDSVYKKLGYAPMLDIDFLKSLCNSMISIESMTGYVEDTYNSLTDYKTIYGNDLWSEGAFSGISFANGYIMHKSDVENINPQDKDTYPADLALDNFYINSWVNYDGSFGQYGNYINLNDFKTFLSEQIDSAKQQYGNDAVVVIPITPMFNNEDDGLISTFLLKHIAQSGKQIIPSVEVVDGVLTSTGYNTIISEVVNKYGTGSLVISNGTDSIKINTGDSYDSSVWSNFNVNYVTTTVIFVPNGFSYIVINAPSNMDIYEKIDDGVPAEISLSGGTNYIGPLTNGFVLHALPSMGSDGSIYYTPQTHSSGHCSEKINTIDVSNYDSSNITDASFMFEYIGCYENWSLSAAPTMQLDLSTMDTSRFNNVRRLFYHVYLDSLNLSNWDLSGLDSNNSNINEMFTNAGINTVILNNVDNDTYSIIYDSIVYANENGGASIGVIERDGVTTSLSNE